MDLLDTPLKLFIRLGLAVLVFASAAGAVLPGGARAQVLSPGPLSRAHHELDNDDSCSQCHASGQRVDTNACLRCHGDLRARIQAGAGLHGREYRGRDCGSCHVEHVGATARLVRWPEGQEQRFDHRLAGWPLHGAHDDLRCAQCHNRRNSRGHATFLGLATTCVSCHRDPHDGAMGTTCQSCHSDTAWRPANVGSFDHSRARFPLRGQHAQVACASCHHEPPRYRGIAFQTCASCHEDPHQGRLGPACATCHNESGWTNSDLARANHPGLRITGGHARVACQTCHTAGNTVAPPQGSECVSCHRPVHDAPFGRDCVRCHASIRWTGLPDSVGRRAHGATPFPLRGAHDQVACTGCHDPNRRARERYRELAFDKCSRCHEDRHAGEFAQRDGGECAGCHDDTGFRPTRFDVAAHANTAFPLTGLHEAAPCSGCHQNPRPRLDLHVANRTCESCHQNPHGDQFATEMARGGCASCHTTAGWDRPNIDHDIWPLTGAHATAECGACHDPTPEDRASGRGASYRGAPRDCASCHEDAHQGQFQASEPRRTCDDCHTTTSFTIAHFDHERTAHFALDGAHVSVACTSCHAARQVHDAVTTTIWRLGYRACRDCHANPHREGSR